MLVILAFTVLISFVSMFRKYSLARPGFSSVLVTVVESILPLRFPEAPTTPPKIVPTGPNADPIPAPKRALPFFLFAWSYQSFSYAL